MFRIDTVWGLEHVAFLSDTSKHSALHSMTTSGREIIMLGSNFNVKQLSHQKKWERIFLKEAPYVLSSAANHTTARSQVRVEYYI